jgi:hypothetical protein
MAELEERVLKIVRNLARVYPLTPEAIRNNSDITALSAWSPKRIRKSIFQAAKVIRARRQFGKLRAALLIGTTSFGDQFLVPTERTGILLADRPEDASFSKFLTELFDETINSDDPAWKILHGRLKSYLAHQELLNSRAKNNDALRFLRTRPRRLVRTVLVVTAMAFLRAYFEFQIPKEFSDLIDELGPPEDIASVASILVVLANEHYPLDSLDFAFPGVDDSEMSEVHELMMYGKSMMQQFEVAKYISLFRYNLERISAQHLVFCLKAPFPECSAPL